MVKKYVLEKIVKSGLEKIYFLANIYHCENIDKVADEIVSKYNIKLESYVKL